MTGGVLGSVFQQVISISHRNLRPGASTGDREAKDSESRGSFKYKGRTPTPRWPGLCSDGAGRWGRAWMGGLGLWKLLV